MTIGIAFWVLMLIWLVFGFWQYRATPTLNAVGGDLLLFVLLILLGWHEFGAPIHG